MAALLAFLPAAGHDQLWLLHVADAMLHGERLYGPTLLESNPPLIVWLTLLPAGLSHLLHLPAAFLGKTLVVVLQLALLPFYTRLLRRMVPDLVATHGVALLFAAIVVLDVLPARDLGQRDHLLAILVLPYLLAVAARAVHLRPPAVEGILAGLLAAVGFALKPHEALVPVALELWLILRHRSLRSLLHPEPLLLLAGACLYPAAILKLTPNYVSDVLPILRDTYWAFGHRTAPQLVLDAIELCLLELVTMALWWSGRHSPGRDAAQAGAFCERDHLRVLTLTLLLAALAATLAYGLQGTGWYYQQLPGLTFASFALWLLLLPRLERLSLPAWTPRAAAGLSILAVGLTTHFMGYPFTADRSFPIDSPDPHLFAGLRRGAAVATLTTTVDDTVMPAEKFHLRIAQRYPHLWMLPAILRNETPNAGAPPPPRHRLTQARLAELQVLQHRFMLEDLLRWQPELVLVARCQDPSVHCQVLEDSHPDLLAWFRNDPDFERYWAANYRLVSDQGSYAAWRRIQSPSAHPGPASVQ